MQIKAPGQDRIHGPDLDTRIRPGQPDPECVLYPLSKPKKMTNISIWFFNLVYIGSGHIFC